MRKKIKTSAIIFRKDLYPRIKQDQSLIQDYADSIKNKKFPPITVNQDNILIDGYHRWKAHEKAGLEEIAVEVIETKSEKEIDWLATKLNATHGKQLSNEEKRAQAIKFVGDKSTKEIASWLSVAERTVRHWTQRKRETLEELRNKEILALYLDARMTQTKIAKKYETTKSVISEIIKKFVNGKIAESEQNYKPPANFLVDVECVNGSVVKDVLSSIWYLKDENNKTSNVGLFPQHFMNNFLYLHTKPLDVVFDCFAGEGITIDACQKMYRRYYCCDKKVEPGREDDIFKHDIIKNGLPAKMPKPDLVFLDPLYLRQEKGKHIDNKFDIPECLEHLKSIIKELISCKIRKIAVFVRPGFSLNPPEYFGYSWLVKKGIGGNLFPYPITFLLPLPIEMRYTLLYPQDYYSKEQVETAKENKICLNLNRDLVIFRLK